MPPHLACNHMAITFVNQKLQNYYKVKHSTDTIQSGCPAK